MRRSARRVLWSIDILVLFCLLVVTVSINLAEGALHVPRSARVPPSASAADQVAVAAHATWESVAIRADDGAVLKGWLFQPRQAASSAVIMLHGVSDTRTGVLGPARMLLDHSYAVLTPDSRGHGESGGEMITYGVKEAGDVRCWARWLTGERRFSAIYGLGESLGAAELLQAIGQPTPFLAVVAECPFVSFRQIAADRLQQKSGLGQPALRPLVSIAFEYVRLRYGVDLDLAAPVAALRSANVPVLLIHGSADTNIPPWHSRALHEVNLRATTLWQVQGAEHVSAIFTAPQEYELRVLGWFDAHR